MRYVNHKGAEFDFDAPGIHTHRGKIRNYSWDISIMAGRVGSAVRADAKIPVAVNLALPAADCVVAKDRMCEVLDTDPIAAKAGRLYDGEWYVDCLLGSSAKDLWWYDGGVAVCELEFYAPKSMWTCEHDAFFAAGDTSGGLNFPLGFPFDFGGGSGEANVLVNPGFCPAPLRIDIYGPAENPRIVIGGNAYEVECDVPKGGRLVVDGMAKTIELFDPYGRVENAFAKRRGVQMDGSGSYAFQRVPPGTSVVSWDGSFAFTATLFEQRGEPRWSA